MDVGQELARWREYAGRQSSMSPEDVDELEEHLHDQMTDLAAAGLEDDEAFLIAVKRMGRLDEISREFARVHSERLWKQLVPADPRVEDDRLELVAALALGVGAAVAARIGLAVLTPAAMARLAGVAVLPFLAGYFAWKRRVPRRTWLVLASIFVVAGLALGLPRFDSDGTTVVLVAIHAPVLLWLVCGLGYAGEDWRSPARRMDFIRFTGEWAVYYTLIALGGGVLTGLTAGVFTAIGMDPSTVLSSWVVPCGAAGAVLVAAWLVEAKQAVIENIAPVLTLVFTPLMLALLLAVLGGFVASPGVLHHERDLLIVMALILVLVLGLWLYAVSARTAEAPPGLFDRLQLAMVLAAIAVDLVLLVAMVGRISEFGASANKVAALGLNVVVLVNLTVSAWLGGRFVSRRGPFAPLERWQTTYLPVYGLWTAVVAVVLPPLFGYN